MPAPFAFANHGSIIPIVRKFAVSFRKSLEYKLCFASSVNALIQRR